MNFKMHKEKVCCKYLVAISQDVYICSYDVLDQQIQNIQKQGSLRNLQSITTELCGKLP